MTTSILVKDFMNHDPFTVTIDANVRDVVDGLLRAHVTGCPVINPMRQVVGFVSEQDCIKALLNDTFYCEEPSGVTTVMKTEVVTVTPETSIVEIAESMSDHRPKNYPVVDETGRLIGMINRAAVLKALLESVSDCYLRT